MYSGGDSNGDGVSDFNRFGHFQLPGTTACNFGNAGGSIDWASLAQQWIQMKDCSASHIPATMPEPPPPPNISGISVPDQISFSDTKANDELACPKKSRFDEKGEADMEMDDEEESGRLLQNATRNHISESVSAPLLQPNWFIQHSLEPAGIPTETIPTQPSQDSSQWGMWPTRVLLTPSSSINEIVHPTSHIPSLMKINIPHPTASPALTVPTSQRETNPAPAVDAAKRKVLPAWIREGLEKMEREKQKLIERQQKIYHNEGTGIDYSDADLEPINMDTVNNKNLSNVESDNSVNEDEDNEKVYESTTTSYVDKSTVDAHEIPNSDVEEQVDAQKSQKNYEQILSDMMVVVRRTLTELLLEVTNEEISTVSSEAIKAYKAKASAAQVISKSAIATITGKLGLAAYEDSSSASSGSEADDEAFKENISDSEEEIKASIRLKHKAFAKISEEIEKRIAESDFREEQKLKYYTQQETRHHEQEESNQNEITGTAVDREGSTCGISICNPYRSVGSSGVEPSPYGIGKGYDLEFGETTDTKLQFSNGKRQRERTTRFSDNKDSRGGGVGIVANTDLISQFKSINHSDNITKTINSTVLQKQSDVSLKSLPDISSKSLDQTFSNVINAAEKTKSKEKPYGKRHHPKSNTSENNDSSTNSDSSETSTSRSSSRNSKSSHSKYKSSRHRHTHRLARSNSSVHKSSRARSRERYSERYKYDRKSRHRRDHSSNSDDYSDNKYSNSKKRRTKRSKTHYHDHHRRDRKSKRSRSRSRSKSSYSSSRRRH